VRDTWRDTHGVTHGVSARDCVATWPPRARRCSLFAVRCSHFRTPSAHTRASGAAGRQLPPRARRCSLFAVHCSLFRTPSAHTHASRRGRPPAAAPCELLFAVRGSRFAVPNTERTHTPSEAGRRRGSCPAAARRAVGVEPGGCCRCGCGGSDVGRATPAQRSRGVRSDLPRLHRGPLPALSSSHSGRNAALRANLKLATAQRRIGQLATFHARRSETLLDGSDARSESAMRSRPACAMPKPSRDGCNTIENQHACASHCANPLWRACSSGGRRRKRAAIAAL
jgi:hypothetical protein